MTSLSELGPSRFSADFDSGSLIDLRKTGPGEFEFVMQSREVHGEQGSLMVWFYGRCDLSGIRVSEGQRLRMTVPPPHRLGKIRPVYSYDNESWDYVPDPYGPNGDVFRFEIPMRPGAGAVYFAAHFPYPSARMHSLVARAARSGIASVGSIGLTEEGRDIPVIRVGEPGSARVVLLSAGSHAGETASLWGMEGIIEFLVSGCPESTEMLRSTVFHIVPMLNVDGTGLGLDRRQSTGVNIYFDYRSFASAEARAMWGLVEKLRPDIWLDFHSWHTGVAEGAYGPDPSVIGAEAYSTQIKPLRDAINTHFPIKNWGPDTLDCPNTQALLQHGISGFCPEFNMGLGADGRWKTCEDNKLLGIDILRALRRRLPKAGSEA